MSEREKKPHKSKYIYAPNIFQEPSVAMARPRTKEEGGDEDAPEEVGRFVPILSDNPKTEGG